MALAGGDEDDAADGLEAGPAAEEGNDARGFAVLLRGG